MEGLTRAQRAVLVAIAQHWAEHGSAPTYRDIVKVCQFASPNAVTVHAAALVRKGHLHADAPLRPRRLVESIRTVAAQLVKEIEVIPVAGEC